MVSRMRCWWRGSTILEKAPQALLCKMRADGYRVVASFEGGKGPDIILFQEIEADQTPGATPPDYAAILQRYAGTNIRISASIGVFLLRPGAGLGVDEALHQADDALYMAKNRGRNCVHAAEGIS